MNQREEQWPSRVASLLDAGADGIEPRIAERLAAARKEALSHYRPEPAPVWSWAVVTNNGHNGRSHRGEGDRHSIRTVLLAAALLAALAIGVTWQSTPGAPDIADIDAALLTDELPINAFLDQGFDSWLKRASR